MKTQTCFKPIYSPTLSSLDNLLPSRIQCSPPDPQNLREHSHVISHCLTLHDLYGLPQSDVPHSWRYPNVTSWWVIFHVESQNGPMVHPCRKACWNLHGTFPRDEKSPECRVFSMVFFHGCLGCPMSEQTQIQLWAPEERLRSCLSRWSCLNRQKGVEDDCVYLQQPRIPQK